MISSDIIYLLQLFDQGKMYELLSVLCADFKNKESSFLFNDFKVLQYAGILAELIIIIIL